MVFSLDLDLSFVQRNNRDQHFFKSLSQFNSTFTLQYLDQLPRQQVITTIVSLCLTSSSSCQCYHRPWALALVIVSQAFCSIVWSFFHYDLAILVVLWWCFIFLIQCLYYCVSLASFTFIWIFKSSSCCCAHTSFNQLFYCLLILLPDIVVLSLLTLSSNSEGVNIVVEVINTYHITGTSAYEVRLYVCIYVVQRATAYQIHRLLVVEWNSSYQNKDDCA